MRRESRCEQRRGQRGQSLVEMALVLPLLMILLVGVVDVGRAMFAKIAITNASREGARYASRFPADKPGAIDAVRDELELNGLDSALVDVTIDPDPAGNWLKGLPITVSLTYPYGTILGGIIGMGEIEIGATTEMIVYGVGD